MISCVYQEIILSFHHILVCIETHTFCHLILCRLVRYLITHMVLTKSNHTLIEWNFRSTCVHIHLLILGRHLYHLILLIHDLLLQIQLTILLRVLPQVSLINNNLHLLLLLILCWYLLLLLLVWYNLLVALRSLAHVLD